MRASFFALLTAAAIGLSAPALAQPFVLDKSHAHIAFTVDHLGFSTVMGQFREFDAEIDFDPDDVEAAKVRFVIQAASVDTFWEARDKHIRSKDFFDVETYPEIVFESTSVAKTGADTAEITGNLTIKDVTKEITLEAQLNKLGPSPFDASKTIAGFRVTGEIDRTEFGVSYAAPAVGAIIPIEAHFEMSPAS